MRDASTRPDRAVSVHVDAHGIVHVIWTPGTQITAELAEDAMRAVDTLHGSRSGPLCVTMSRVEPPTRAGREVFSRACSATRVALVGQTPTDRLIASFSLGTEPSPVPREFFTSTDTALEWLLDEGVPE